MILRRAHPHRTRNAEDTKRRSGLSRRNQGRARNSHAPKSDRGHPSCPHRRGYAGVDVGIISIGDAPSAADGVCCYGDRVRRSVVDLPDHLDRIIDFDAG